MKKRIISLILALVLIVSVLPLQALAASYPLITPIVRETSYTIPEGEVGYLKFLIWHEYKNERYNVNLYDSDGYKVASASRTDYVTTYSTEYTVSVDTADLDLEVGKYTVEYWVDFYTYYNWYSAPNKYTYTLEIVSNKCKGDHSFKKDFVLEEATCEEEGCARYICKDCGHMVYRTTPKAHDYDKGELYTYPTPKQDGTIIYTCNTCGATKTESFSKSHAVKITKQPKSAYAFNGEKATTTVKATGDGLKYQWYVKDAGASKYTKSSCTSASYSCKLNSANNNRRVYCVVTDQYGNSLKTDVVILRMKASILEQPTSITVANGKRAKVQLEAEGTDLTYTWYYSDNGGKKFSKASSFKGNNYYITMNKDRSGRLVYCVVKDKYGNTSISDVVSLNMTGKVTIKTQPKGGTYTKNSVAKATVKASGTGLKYEWWILNPGNKTWTKASATGNSYSFKITSANSGRKAYCVITDKKGNKVTTDVVTFQMKSAVKITQEPADQVVKVGKTATATVKASGSGLKYEWWIWNASTKKWGMSSATGNSYSFKMSTKTSGRMVYCKVTNASGHVVSSKIVNFYAIP